MFDNSVDITTQYGSNKVEPKQKLPSAQTIKRKRRKAASPIAKKKKSHTKPKLTKQQKYEYWKEKENERFWMSNL